MDLTEAINPGVLLSAFVAIGFLPRYLLTRPKGYVRVFLLTFLVLFSLNFFHLFYVVSRFELMEAILRSVFGAAVPFITAYVFVRICGKAIIEHWKQAGIGKSNGKL